jgi:hypothetical protein
MKTTTDQMTTMTVTKVITRSNLRTILSEVNNPDFISFVSRTPEKMNQYLDYWLTGDNGKKTKNTNPTVNPFFENGIFNLSRKYKIVTGFDYEKSINRRLEKEGKEGNFEGGYKPTIDEVTGEVKQREVWFDILSKGLVTDKKTRSKFYLRYQFLKDSTIGQPEYFHNGNTIEKQMFESYLTKKSEGYQNQGLDDTLNFQVCDLNNILFLSMGGEVYELID